VSYKNTKKKDIPIDNLSIAETTETNKTYLELRGVEDCSKKESDSPNDSRNEVFNHPPYATAI
jgi:hypothetical protein